MILRPIGCSTGIRLITSRAARVLRTISMCLFLVDSVLPEPANKLFTLCFEDRSFNSSKCIVIVMLSRVSSSRESVYSNNFSVILISWITSASFSSTSRSSSSSILIRSLTEITSKFTFFNCFD